jgi:hypothetical protein
MVLPLVTQWLGGAPRSALTIIDLPESDDTPFETGSALLIPVHDTAPESLAPVLAHAWAHAFFQSSRAWLNEGVATFLGTLWTEAGRGRAAALAQLDQQRLALALVEPAGQAQPAQPDASNKPAASPASSEDSNFAADAPAKASPPGEDPPVPIPLTVQTSPEYFRTKAAYVFWMLRDLAGDAPLAAALAAYRPGDDADPGAFEALLAKASWGKDLHWFFADWVDQDRGLPGLAISGVYSNAARAPGSYVVAVEIRNDGGAAAEVPVTVQSAAAALTERARIPGRGKAVHRFVLEGLPREVAVNDGTVPEVESTRHVRAIEQAPAR